MTEQKTDPTDDQKKKREPLEIDLSDDHDSSGYDEFHGLDESVASAEEEWEKRSGKSKGSQSEEAQLAELFALATPGATAVGEKPLSIPGEPMRGPLSEKPETQWRVNVPEVLGPNGDNATDKPHQEHFKEFGMFMSGREVNLPGTENPTLRLGRNPLKTDLSFTDGYVSREHANITKEGGKVYITNLQTSNTTTIIRDGKEITVGQSPAKTELLPGDTIRLGKYSEMQWMRAAEIPNLGKPALYRPKPGEADPAASQTARRESNQYLRSHEYAKPFPDGFQNVGGINQIDDKGWHHDKERPSVVVDQRPGADPALAQFVKDMKEKYSHLAGDPKALAEALAKEAKTALEPKGWSSAAVDDGYSKLRSENAGQRMLLGDFITAAKYSKGAGVCNHQAMLTKVAFDSFYPADMPGRPEMKMIRGFYGESPAGLTPEMAMNHAWNTLTVPNRDGTTAEPLLIDPRDRVYGDALAAHPNYHSGKDIPQLRPVDQIPKMADFKEAPLTKQEIERLKGQEVRYGTKGWKLQNIEGDRALISSYALKNADESSLASVNPEAAKSGKWVIGQEYNIKRSNGELESGWTLNNVVDVDGKKVFVLGKEGALVRPVMLEDLQRQNGEVFEQVVQERAAQQRAAEIPGPVKVNPESHGFVAGREVFHNGERWVVQGSNGKDIEVARAATKNMSQASFEELNGNTKPQIGNDYLIRRSSGEVERWKLTGIDNNTGELTLRSQTAYREKVSLERLAEQNRNIVGPLDVSKVLADPASKVRLIARWTDGNSDHDKWLAEVEGAKGERLSAMVHKPPHGNTKDWVRLKNDLAAQELAKSMGAPELFPPTVYRDGVMVQAFLGRQGENVASFLHDRSRQDPELRASERDLEKRMQKLLEKDPALRAKVAEGIAFSVLLGDHDQHGLNFVINRDGAGPNDFHIARIDTDYAFSRDRKPVMDQAGNYGSIINGAFAHLSEKDLPPDVRAKIKTVSDQLSTQAGREAFQKATNLSSERVEALAERARIMSETGKFPRSKTMDEQRRELGIGSVKAKPEAGDAFAAEKIGTVKAAPDNLQANVEKTVKMLTDLQTELAKGGQLEGERLETVRKQLKELLKQDPTLGPVFKDLSDKINPALYPNRPEQIMSKLNSSDKSTRCDGIRQEISRLMSLPKQTAADEHEVARLKRALFQEMKEDNRVSRELNNYYERTERNEKLSDTEAARFAALKKTESSVDSRLQANIDFAVKVLKAEARASMLSGSTRGGDATQGMIMKMFEKKLTEPRADLNGRSYASMGYEVVPLKTSVAMDDAGADFILVNKKTGDYIFIDPTQKPIEHESKAGLPQIRKQGVISSDPYADRYTDGDRRNVGSDRYEELRKQDISNQIDRILSRAKNGSALNLADIIIPPSTSEAVARTNDGKFERLEKIRSMPDMERALAVKQWRTELEARQQGLNEMVQQAKEKSELLKQQAATEKDTDRKVEMLRQSQELKDWYEHTQGNSRVHPKGSPLIFINRTLEDLNAIELRLPDKLQPLSRTDARPGQTVNVPPDVVQKLKDSTVQLQDQQAIVTGKKIAGHLEIAAAADRFASMSGLDGNEVDELLDLKNRSEYRDLLAKTGIELTNEYLSKGNMAKPQAGKSTAVELTMDYMLELQEHNRTWTEAELKDFKALTKAYKRGDADAVEEVHKRISTGIDSATGGTARGAFSKPEVKVVDEQQKKALEEMTLAKDFNKMKEFAHTTTDPELARQAVKNLREAKPENLIQTLKEIAGSKSYAAGAALEGLYMETDAGPELDAYRKIVADRFNNGEFLQMVKDGKMSVKELVSALDKSSHETSGKYIGELLDKLSEAPALKEKVAIEVLTEDPYIRMFDRDVPRTFEHSAVSNETRLKAIEFLGKQNSQESVKTLQAVMLDRDKAMADAARKTLLEKWTNQKQSTTGETISELSVGDRLKRFTEELGKVNWPDQKDLTELQKRHIKADAGLFDAKWNLADAITPDIDEQDKIAEKFEDQKYMEDYLKDRPAELKQYRDYLKQGDEAKAIEAEYTGILKTRMDVVDAYVKKYCKELGISPPQLEFFTHKGSGSENLGEYSNGAGKIAINDKLVLTGKNPSPEFLDALFHELGHHEQDSLGVRRLADELKIGKTASPEEIAKLRELHKDRLASHEMPDEKFISDVIKQRDGVALTDGQNQRADKLIESFRQRQLDTDRRHELERYSAKLQKNAKYLRENVPLAIVLGGEDPVEKAKEVLRVKEIPPELEKALKDWRDIEKNSPERDKVEGNMRKLLARAFERAGGDAAREAYSNYRKEAHEIETWDIGTRSKFLAKEAAAERLAAQGTGTVSTGKEGYVRPRRGPAPVADSVTTTTYESNPDGTQRRRTEVAGKPLIGDEKTWKDLLTKEELAQIREKRESLEKLEKDRKLSDEARTELAALRELEANLHDPAAHRRIIERLGERRPPGGFRGGELVGRLSGIAIITSAVLGWCASKSGADDSVPRHVPLDKK